MPSFAEKIEIFGNYPEYIPLMLNNLSIYKTVILTQIHILYVSNSFEMWPHFNTVVALKELFVPRRRLLPLSTSTP